MPLEIHCGIRRGVSRPINPLKDSLNRNSAIVSSARADGRSVRLEQLFTYIADYITFSSNMNFIKIFLQYSCTTHLFSSVTGHARLFSEPKKL